MENLASRVSRRFRGSGLLPTYLLAIIAGLFSSFVGSTMAAADTITNYTLSGVTFSTGSYTWGVSGRFTYDDFDIGGSGTESNAVFTITGPSIAYTGTYSQIASATSTGNGFYATGTRTDGTPTGLPYDVVLFLNEGQVYNQVTTPVTTVLFVVPGYGNFSSYAATGEAIASPVPAPPSWAMLLSGMIILIPIVRRQDKRLTPRRLGRITPV
jgi:hypothetical protein